MNQLGLFEGIGGFLLAGRLANFTPKAWCEIDPYCQLVLKKNFPEAHGFGDIKTLSYATYKSVLRNRGDRDRRIDIITGGFPCQPYSIAGKRAGANDDRALWPQMLRQIQEFKPAFVLGENVAGILSMDGGRVFSNIITDLENEGYTVETYRIPAIALGAPHRRDRIWIIAHRNRERSQTQPILRQRNTKIERQNSPAQDTQCHRRNKRTTQQTAAEFRKLRNTCARVSIRSFSPQNTSDTYSSGRPKRRPTPEPADSRFCTRCAYAGWTFIHSQCGTTQNDGHGTKSGKFWQADEHRHGDIRNPWQEHWLPVAARICRVDDGIPEGMDGTGPLPSNAKNPKNKAGRGHRLKALGNSIVHQIALVFFEAINDYLKNNPRHPLQMS